MTILVMRAAEGSELLISEFVRLRDKINCAMKWLHKFID
jgi:hypothetical protein